MQEGASRPADPAQRKLAWPQAIPPPRPKREVPSEKFQVPKEADFGWKIADGGSR
jgi:hypothetical protein